MRSAKNYESAYHQKLAHKMRLAMMVGPLNETEGRIEEIAKELWDDAKAMQIGTAVICGAIGFIMGLIL